VPILWQNSENEAGTRSRDDGGLYKFQEVPGSSHVNYWDKVWQDAFRVRDHGSAAGQGPEANWDPEGAGRYGSEEGSNPEVRTQTFHR
jgi:hypothetical protein